MKKWIMLTILSIQITTHTAAEGSSQPGLSWRDRIQAVRNAVNDIFSAISNRESRSNWTVNSAHFTGLFNTGMEEEDGVDQRLVFKTIIKDSYKKGQRAFYTINLGASRDF